MNSAGSDWELPQPSFLIQKSPDQRLFASFPEHIAGYHVFRRLLMPRHPPCTLSSLTTFIDHRHDQLEEELTPEPVISGRADNGTNDQYCVLKFCHRMKPTHLRTRATGELRSPKRCSTTPTRTERPKMGGGRVFNVASRLTQLEL